MTSGQRYHRTGGAVHLPTRPASNVSSLRKPYGRNGSECAPAPPFCCHHAPPATCGALQGEIARAPLGSLRWPPAGNGRWNRPAKGISKRHASAGTRGDTDLAQARAPDGVPRGFGADAGIKEQRLGAREARAWRAPTRVEPKFDLVDEGRKRPGARSRKRSRPGSSSGQPESRGRRPGHGVSQSEG